MNRGHVVHQSSPVQQMMAAGNPNWWNINHTMRPPLSQQPSSSSPNFFSNNTNNNNNFLLPPYPYPYPYSYPPNSNSLPFPPNSNWHANQELPESWSQLLMGEEEKKMGNWEEQMLISEAQNAALVDVKQESSSVNSYVYGHGHSNNNKEFQAAKQQTAANNWSHHHHHQIVSPSAAAAASSPKSCVTTSFSSNMLDFSSNNKTDARHPPPDRSSECNSNGGGGVAKKARVQQSTTQSSSTFKVRKEKLGDRITALHQLVSPFGKTDTASVLLEAIGYIRFLQNQIEALSLPYLGSGSPNIRQQHSVQGEKNCLFPEDPGQLLNESCLKRKATSEQDNSQLEEGKKDLRSRGLCLVPVSCTLQVGSENGADYWAPSLGGPAFR